MPAMTSAPATVEQVLAEREGLAGRGPAMASLAAAALLHVALAAFIILLPRLMPPPPPLEYVDVQVVPAQRLGAQRPAAPQPDTPRPQPPPPAKPEAEPPVPAAPVLPVPRPKPPPTPPTPQKTEKPKPAAPPDERIDPTTRPKLLPPPRELLAHKLGPTAPTPPVAAAPGAATGSAAGKAAVGSLTVSLENQDFTYNYYIAQTQSRIEQNWTRSPVGEARARISFRIHSDGSISDLTVAESSGFDTFDLAALRAVQNAAPFPPLPRAYTASHESVSVYWIAR